MDPAKPDIRSGHRSRLRDKFLKDGLSKFTDEEIIELLLTFGTPRRDCKQAARQLLKEMGTIRSIFEAAPDQLASVTGVGPSNIVAIKFIYSVAGQYLEQRLVGMDYVSSSQKVYQYLRHHLESRDKEIFKVLFLDSANGILALEDGSLGTVSAATVYPREIIERALTLRASGLVFVHNHPSGRARPSQDDFRLTRRLLHAAFLVDMKVVDHLIIGKGVDFFSFRDQGHLTRYEEEIRHFYFSRS